MGLGRGIEELCRRMSHRGRQVNRSERQRSGNVTKSLSKSRKLVLIKFIRKDLRKGEEKRPPT